jgi:hypothetical protein
VKLDLEAGRWCPLDGTTLKVRLDGYGCPACGAAWDVKGRSGRWLPASAELSTVEPVVRWRLSPLELVAGVTGCAVAAAGVVAMLGELDERLVWWLAAVVGAAVVLLLAGAWLARQIEDRRYRHLDGEVTR